jgi:chemotaxis signal transduction protein
VLTLGDEDTGVVVDRVTGVVRIRPETVRPVPETLEHGAECLKGIARKDDRLYILLDIEKTLGV